MPRKNKFTALGMPFYQWCTTVHPQMLYARQMFMQVLQVKFQKTCCSFAYRVVAERRMSSNASIHPVDPGSRNKICKQ